METHMVHENFAKNIEADQVALVLLILDKFWDSIIELKILADAKGSGKRFFDFAFLFLSFKLLFQEGHQGLDARDVDPPIVLEAENDEWELDQKLLYDLVFGGVQYLRLDEQNLGFVGVHELLQTYFKQKDHQNFI